MDPIAFPPLQLPPFPPSLPPSLPSPSLCFPSLTSTPSLSVWPSELFPSLRSPQSLSGSSLPHRCDSAPLPSPWFLPLFPLHCCDSSTRVDGLRGSRVPSPPRYVESSLIGCLPFSFPLPFPFRGSSLASLSVSGVAVGCSDLSPPVRCGLRGSAPHSDAAQVPLALHNNTTQHDTTTH